MTLPPDDLPRSPTGRVPQWVHDDLAGRPTSASAWRAPDAMSTAAPGFQAPGHSRREHPRRRFLTLVVCVALAGGGWLAYQRYPDQAAALVASATNLSPASAPPPPPLPAAIDRTFPVPGYEEAAAPLGAPAAVAVASPAYAFQGTQQAADGTTVPIAWSPCRPIHVVIDPTGAPAGFADDVQVAIGDVSSATGLVFVADGETTEPASSGRDAFLPAMYGDRWAPVLIRFADPTTLVDLAGDVAGLATAQRVQESATGVSYIVSGAVYLDTELLTAPAGEPVAEYLPVLRHELGHLVGLDHVNDPTQLMNPLTSDVSTFQAGDLTGLAALGAGSCAPTI